MTFLTATTRIALATLLLFGLAACAPGPSGGGSTNPGTDTSGSDGSDSKAPPSVPKVELAPCPAALKSYFADNQGKEVDATSISAYTDGKLKLLPSCAFVESDVEGEQFYSVYYITDDTDAVIGYFNDAFASAGFESQVADSTESGTWDVGDVVFSADRTTEPDDANPPSEIIATTYVDVFIA